MGSPAVTLSVKAEILLVIFVGKMFRGKRTSKFKKKLESQIHEPFSMFQKYSELTFCQMK